MRTSGRAAREERSPIITNIDIALQNLEKAKHTSMAFKLGSKYIIFLDERIRF